MIEEVSDYRGKQDGVVVFGISGPESFALNEVVRYTHQYSEEGPVFVEKKINGRWKPVVLWTQTESGVW